MAQRAVLRRTDHKPMTVFLTTHQVFVDIRFAIGHPAPLHVLRSVAQVLTGLGPDLGLASASEPLLRGFSWPAAWRPHIILLVPYPQHLDGAPLAIVLWGVWPAHTQDSVHKEALEPCGTVADRSETRHGVFPRPGQLRRVFQ